MPGPRSQRLAWGASNVPGPITIYTSPANTTTILKRLNLYRAGGTTGTVGIRFGAGGGFGNRYATYSMAVSATINVDFWAVLHAGDTISIDDTGTGSVWFWLSGAHLEA